MKETARRPAAADQADTHTAEAERHAGAKGRADRTTLVETVSAALRTSITDGPLAPGDKLESEAELTKRFKVSRTVVREAIAALRSDGLVEPRQGVGVFVTSAAPALQPLLLQQAEREKISKIVEMLELRVAVEAEAAALAASRRSPAQEHAVWECYDEIEACISEGRSTSLADFEFHLACADATNNPRFRELLELIGENVIPRASLAAALQGGNAPERSATSYLRQIQQEHLAIAEAISARDPEGARAAMHTHLEGSMDRYRTLTRAKTAQKS